MTATRPRVPSALDALDEILGRVGGLRPAVFLDYDGTLTPIVDRPADALLAPAMRERVARLAARTPVAVVSGRDLADVASRVGVAAVTYAGSHGMEIRGPAVTRDVGAAAAVKVGRALEALRRRLPDVPGLVLEPKRFGVSVHYRLVDPARVDAIAAVVDRVVADHPGLRRHDGKMVFDVQPDVPWDKGRAVGLLLEALGGPDRLHPIYLGDDRTDEDAFDVLRTVGTGIVVWEEARETMAHYHLRDTTQVGVFLDALGTAID